LKNIVTLMISSRSKRQEARSKRHRGTKYEKLRMICWLQATGYGLQPAGARSLKKYQRFL
ncbi:MAG: hypothetical protein AB1765_11435, partial [Candidatus Hydrogenedentota bacterium]